MKNAVRFSWAVQTCRSPGFLQLWAKNNLSLLVLALSLYGPVRAEPQLDSGSIQTLDKIVVTAENIERIEVIKDASSSMYGSDALGGVINIFTKKGTTDPQLKYDLSGGSRFRCMKTLYGP